MADTNCPVTPAFAELRHAAQAGTAEVAPPPRQPARAEARARKVETRAESA